MEPKNFVAALERECRDSAVEGCLEDFESPSGRRPDPALVQMSKWFNSLASDDREMVVKAMREAADATLFGILCVLDGVRPIEDGAEKSSFKLIAEKENKQSVICPGAVDLHDVKQSL